MYSKSWIQKELLNSDQLAQIELKISKFHKPAGTGRIRVNISNGHSGFTASNWTIMCSPVIFKDFRYWLFFVHACSLPKANTLKKQDYVQLTYVCKFVAFFRASLTFVSTAVSGRLWCMPCILVLCFWALQWSPRLNSYHSWSYWITVDA